MSNFTENDMLEMNPQKFRSLVRRGEWKGATVNVCRGYAMTDIVILPKEYAYDFLVFCHRNKLAAPVVDITETGVPHPPLLAPSANLCTDLPKYRVYKNGEIVDEPADIKKYWREDLVAFLLGEAGSFHWSWKAANITFQSLGTFSTNLSLVASGPFYGNIFVSCKLFKNATDAVRAIQIASRHPLMHGPPIHIGDPASIGIKDLLKPDVIRPVGQTSYEKNNEEQVPVFWPCFGTIRGVAETAGLPLMIVDYPLHNFVTDKLTEELAVF